MKQHPDPYPSTSVAEENSKLKALVESLQQELSRLSPNNKILSQNALAASGFSAVNPEEESVHILDYERFFATCPITFLLFDLNLRVLLCSEFGAKQLLFKNAAALKGFFYEEAFRNVTNYKLMETGRDLSKKAIMSGAEVVFEGESYLNSGDFHSARAVFSPVMDDFGKCSGVVLAIHNTTEYTLMREMVEKVSRSKTRFMANVSHQIRTPMNAIKGLSELLLTTPLSEVQRDYVRNIFSASHSVTHILNDILDFSKLDATKLDILAGEYALADLLSEVTGIINVLVEKKGLLFITDIDPNLPSRLRGDDVRIKQVLVSLLANAVKFTLKGHIKLTIKSDKGPDPLRLLIEVEDTGIGIEEQEMLTLFEFSRVGIHTHSLILQGAGLGLPIAKNLITAMDGTISVRSTLDQGTCFSILLPQQVMSEKPLAKVRDIRRKEVLILGSGPRVPHYKELFSSLGIFATVCDSREKLHSTPCFTHCLVDYDLDGPFLEECRPQLKDCHILVVKGMQQALSHPVSSDIVLFEPLLVTQLASALNSTNVGSQAEEGEETKKTLLTVTGVKALVVDDNTINRLVTEEILSYFNVDVVAVESGEDAIELCKDTVFDIVFVDHIMPGMDGVETALMLRGLDGPNRDIPIIAISTGNAANLQKDYFRSGINDVICKPLVFPEIVRILMLWLPSEKLMLQNTSV